MKTEEIKSTVIKYAENTSVKEAVLLFEGIVSRNTVYKWMREHKNQKLNYAYTLDQCKREVYNFKKRQPSYDALPCSNRIVHTFQPHFFHKEKELWNNKAIQKRLVENRRKYLEKDTFTDREILRGFKISGIHMGYSHFSPLWFTKFIKDNDIKSVYDPCGGWGHRLIGAYLGDINYIYNDFWDLTYSGCEKIKDLLNYTNCTLYNNDCTQFTPAESYECVFTCPPYGNIEIYNDTPIPDYDLFLEKMLKCCIKDSVRLIGVVINKEYSKNVITSIPSNFKLTEQHALGTSGHISHLNKDNSMKQEILCVFTKSS